MKPPLGAPAELYRNFADDPRMAERAKALVTPMIKRVRTNRQQIDQRAFRRYNQWALITDDRFYVGRANTYIPAVRKGIERKVAEWTRATFPTDRWWDCEATAPEFEPNLDGQKLLISQQLRAAQVKRKTRPLHRQTAIYGTGPAKLTWRYETRTVPAMELLPDGSSRVGKRVEAVHDGPDFKVVDFFSFGVYPETVLDIDDAKLVYEDMVVEVGDLERDKRNYANVSEAKASAGTGSSGTDALLRRRQRLAQLGIAEDELSDTNYVFLTECYTEFDFKDRLGPVPAIITLAWESVVVRLQRNPYLRPPYRVMKAAEMPNEWYAHADTEATDRLQIQLNDTSNQDLDASSFANNPIVVIDPNYVEDYQSIAIYPSAKVPAPPDAVKFDRPPDASFSQKEKIAFLHSLILENLGSPVGSSPSPAAKGTARGARTFGGMQLLQSLASLEAKEFVEFQEDAFWEPLLRDMAWLNAHFLSDERTLRLAGRKGAPVVINRATFAGDYAYEWLGSSTVQSQIVLGAQMLVGMNIARGINPATTGGQIPNLAFMFGEWWESQGLKGRDRLFLNAPKDPIPAAMENELVRVGRAIEVTPQDNDAEHIAVHSRARMLYPPDAPEHQTLLLHEQAHYHQFMMRQQAMQLAAHAMSGAAPTGPQPNGSRAGVKPSGSPVSGFGPARAMADTPGM